MLTYPEIDPIAIQIGPFPVRWYGLTYLISFFCAYWLARYRSRDPSSTWKVEQIGDLVFYGALGTVIGGRVGYMLFYNFSSLIQDPLSFFAVWRGGMSYHGGLLGVIIAMALYARKLNKPVFEVLDFIAPTIPPGFFAVRIANFIGGELYGRVTDVPWAMVFPNGGPLPRHPSQLYEAFLEGIVLFIILWLFSKRTRPRMAVSGLFLIGYGSFRFLVEFVRQPDAHLGFIALDWVSMGQVLSFPMIILGCGFMVWAYTKNNHAVASAMPAVSVSLQSKGSSGKSESAKSNKKKRKK